MGETVRREDAQPCGTSPSPVPPRTEVVDLEDLPAEVGAYEHLSQVVQAMPGGLVVLRRDGIITQVNPAVCELLGATPERLLWQPVFPFLGAGHPAIDGMLDRLVAQAPGEGEASVRQETLWRSAAGRVLPVMLSVRLLRGTEPMLVCVVLDLRREKHLETSLLHAQKLEAVGQLATGIVHEISAPVQFMGDSLHALRMNLDRLVGPDDGASEDPVVQLLREMSTNLSRAATGLERVRGILGAVRGFSHPTREQKRPTDLHEVIASTLVVAVCRTKYVAEVDVQAEPVGRVVCCPGDIRQILLALVMNAVDAVASVHSPESGAGKITVTLAPSEGGVVLAVRDNGCGLDPATAEQIFEPFFSTKPESLGTGQGLAIARQLASANGAQLDARAIPEGGAEFRLRIPH